MVTPELKRLAAILAKWARPAENFTVYLYGSRVRGDHRPDSDVDLYVHFGAFDNVDADWWEDNIQDEFQTIRAQLPGPLKLLEPGDSLTASIIRAGRKPEYRLGNVMCVLLPPKYPPTHAERKKEPCVIPRR